MANSKMMSPKCRETGRQICMGWSDAKADFQTSMQETTPKAQHSRQYEFIRALYQHARGESQYLVDYLRSNRPLSADHRELLAQVLEGVLNRTKKRGRPRNKAERDAAFQADYFYRKWVEANRAKGIRDHGSRDLMKDEAVRFIVEEFEPSSPPLDPEKVRELLDRPKHRRNPG